MEPRLTRKQMVAFRQRIAPILGFLYRCRRRLQTLGFTDSDKIYSAVDEALNAVNAVHFELFWRSVDDSKLKRDPDPQPPRDRDF